MHACALASCTTQVAGQLYRMLPADPSGKVDYRQLVREIRRRYARPTRKVHATDEFDRFASATRTAAEATGAPEALASSIMQHISERRRERGGEAAASTPASAPSAEDLEALMYYDGEEDEVARLALAEAASLRAELVHVMQESGASTAELFRWIECVRDTNKSVCCQHAQTRTRPRPHAQTCPRAARHTYALRALPPCA